MFRRSLSSNYQLALIMQQFRKETIYDYYEFNQKIDEGAFGCVYKATNLRTKETVAIKKMKQLFFDITSAQNVKEVKVLLHLDHPNIIKIKDIQFFDNSLYIVYEYLVTDLLKFYTYYKNQV